MAPGRDPARETIAPDEHALTAQFVEFLKAASIRRYPTGPIRRFNQGRQSGCAEAEFIVHDGLADGLRVGLFARPGSYRAWIRFANAASTSDREKDVRGMSIAVRGVTGQNLTPGATTQDFVLNSHSVMMVPGTREFLELLRAVEAGGVQRAWYFLTHPAAARIAFASRQNHTSHLEIPYWSTTPYLFGQDRAVKYIVQPVSSRRTPLPSPLTASYLHDALRSYLLQNEASFDFSIQFQADARRTPIEDAAAEWRERDSPYVRVARVSIPRQDIDAADKISACEEVSFNPWHCLAEHRPLGGMNRARRDIYAAMQQFRAQPR
jgi:hypothetical protein